MAHQRWLAQPQQDGRSRAKHLEAASKFDARAAADLAGPRIPPEGAYLLAWFYELAAKRQGFSSMVTGAHGASSNTQHTPISFTEMESWARLTGRSPLAWEVDVLGALDAAWLGGGKRWEGGDGDQRDGHP